MPTKKAMKATEEKLRAMIVKWGALLDLDRSGIVFKFVYGANPEDADQSDWTHLAATASRWDYLDGETIFYLAPCSELSDDKLEETFLHEAGHVIVNEMQCWSNVKDESDISNAVEHEERVVTQLARILQRVDRKARESVQN